MKCIGNCVVLCRAHLFIHVLYMSLVFFFYSYCASGHVTFVKEVTLYTEIGGSSVRMEKYYNEKNAFYINTDMSLNYKFGFVFMKCKVKLCILSCDYMEIIFVIRE